MKYPLLSTALICSSLALTPIAMPVLSTPAYAGEWTLGLANISTQEVYYGQADKNFVFPMIAYQEGRYSVGVEGASYQLSGDDNSPVAFFAALGISGDSYDSDDATILQGMKTRHDGVDLGVGAEIDLGMASLSASVVQDVSGSHDGQQLDIALDTTIPIHRYLVLIPELALEGRSKDYVDYYFGVKDSEATALRAAYKGKDTVNTSASLGLVIPITQQWKIINKLSFTKLGEGISDSPLIKRDEVVSGLVMTTYTF